MQNEKTTQPPGSEATVRSRVDPVIGLQHVAGLAAGHTLELQPGAYEFGPSTAGEPGLSAGNPSVGAFRADVEPSGIVRVTPGVATLSIAGRVVTEPRTVEKGELIRVGQDAFVVVDRHSNDRLSVPGGSRLDDSAIWPERVAPVEVDGPSPSLLIWLLIALIGIALAVAVSPWLVVLTALAAIGLAVTRWHHSKALAADRKRHADQVTAAEVDLRKRISDRLLHQARHLRTIHQGPAELFDPSTTRTTRQDRTVVPLGLASQPWQPEVDERQTAGWDYQAVADSFSAIPAAPLLVDLANGPIAITGTRPAVEAMSRYLTALVARRHGVDALSIICPSTDEWAWVSMFPRPTATNPATIMPGIPMPSFTVHDLSQNSASGSVTGMGLVLADDAASLPTGWQAHIELADDGSAIARDRRGNTIGQHIIPHGVTSEAINDLSAPASFNPRIGEIEQGGFVLHVADELREANDLLGVVAANLASAYSPDECAIFVVDDGRRHMIRLQQLAHVRRYLSIDDRNLGSLFDEVELAIREGVVVALLIAQLDEAYQFLIDTGQSPRAKQMIYLAQRSGDERIVVAASATAGTHLPAAIDEAVVSKLHRINDEALVIDKWGERTIRLDQPTIVDLTKAVARTRLS